MEMLMVRAIYLIQGTTMRGMDNGTQENVLDFMSRWHGVAHVDAVKIELMQYLAMMVQKLPREVTLAMQKRIGWYEF
ncbi:hypothetical protein L914_14105, partial [Phytophthora nicotianae]